MIGKRIKFERLYSRHAQGIFSLAWRLCCYNQHDAEDVTQETFVNALQAYSKYKDQQAEFAWLRTICINIVRGRWRRKQFQESLLDEGSKLENLQESADNPHKAAEVSEELRRVIRYLDLIRPEYREALIMKHLAGLTDDEIASIQVTEVSTVRSRVRRARHEIALLMNKEKNQ